MRSVFSLAAVALASRLAVQASLPASAPSLPAESGISTGTLTVAITGPQGCIIAADSRGTLDDGSSTDDQQKLFRTGRHSAVAIAGLGWVKYPFDDLPWTRQGFDASAVIREEFGPSGRADDMGGVVSVPIWLRGTFDQELSRMSAILHVGGRLLPVNFVATVCGWDGKVARVTLLEFTPSDIQFGSRGQRVPLVAVRNQPPFRFATEGGTHIRWVTAGVHAWATAILQGRYRDSVSPAIARYNAALRNGTEGNLTVNDLRELIEEIFKHTMANSRHVGGPLQLAIFTSDGYVIPPKPPQATSTRPKEVALYRRVLLVGGVVDGTRELKKPDRVFALESFNEPLPEPFREIHVGREFRNATIRLDGNYYVGCRFKHCTFEYLADEGLFPSRTPIPYREWPKNRMMGCRLNTPAQFVPLNVLLKFSRCRFSTNTRITLSPPGWAEPWIQFGAGVGRGFAPHFLP